MTHVVSGDPGRPDAEEDRESEGRVAGATLLDVRNLTQTFYAGGGFGHRGSLVHAVTDVSFSVSRQETVGIVGETGCGKSTLARAIMQLPKPRAGEVVLNGEDLVTLRPKALREARRRLQMVYQDPYASLDPRWRVGDQIAEPLRIHKIGTADEQRARSNELMEVVGLDPTRIGPRRPREISGGECQRAALARALSLAPELVILDEPAASMDVSVQAQVLNLLEELRSEFGLSYLFISHDLSVVRHVSDRVIVMFLGKFCEIAPAERIYSAAFHPYSAELITAMPDPRRRDVGPMLREESGDLPSAVDPPSGCRFHPRCAYAQEVCKAREPELREVAPRHFVACHFPLYPISVTGDIAVDQSHGMA